MHTYHKSSRQTLTPLILMGLAKPMPKHSWFYHFTLFPTSNTPYRQDVLWPDFLTQPSLREESAREAARVRLPVYGKT